MKLKQQLFAILLVCVMLFCTPVVLAAGASENELGISPKTSSQETPSVDNLKTNQNDPEVKSTNLDDEERDPVNCVVIFDFNGVTGDAIEKVTVEAGTELTLPEITGLAENSPDFLGWSVDATSIEQLYQPGESLIVSESMTLYAMWKQVIVTYIYGDTTQTEVVLQHQCPTAVPAVRDTEGMTFTGWVDADGQSVNPATQPISEDVTYTAKFAVKFNYTDHVVYINGYEDGTFRPNGQTTRAEAAKMVYSLLLSTDAEITASFSDVESDAWYAESVLTLASMRVFTGYPDGSFLPQNAMTRAEFVAMLARLFYVEPAEGQSFSDVSEEHWAYDYIEYAVGQGWVSGYSDGTFLPEGKITRAEAVTILNRLIGRVGDNDVIFSRELRTFCDLDSDHWAYVAIMEASTAHTCTIEEGAEDETWTSYDKKRAAGLYQDGYELRCTDEYGWDLKNATYGNFEFDATGNYTCGNAEIDRCCKTVLAEVTTEGMTQEEQLRALYEYTRDHFKYQKRSDYQNKEIDWERETLLMFQTEYGNCYNYSSVFYCLARQIGYDAQLVNGTIGQAELAHCWVTIDIDGVTYLFDPQQEKLQKQKGNDDCDLYRIPINEAPWTYTPYAA